MILQILNPQKYIYCKNIFLNEQKMCFELHRKEKIIIKKRKNFFFVFKASISVFFNNTSFIIRID